MRCGQFQVQAERDGQVLLDAHGPLPQCGREIAAEVDALLAGRRSVRLVIDPRVTAAAGRAFARGPMAVDDLCALMPVAEAVSIHPADAAACEHAFHTFVAQLRFDGVAYRDDVLRVAARCGWEVLT